MYWVTRYRIRNYMKSSAWLVPTSAIPLAAVALYCSRWLDGHMGWRLIPHSATGLTTLLQALIPASLTFVALILSTLLLAVQLASSQFSPRLIGGLLSLPEVRWCLFLFVFDFIFSAGTLGRSDQHVPQLAGLIAVAGTALSTAAALFLIDFLARELRPVRMLSRTATLGRRVIDEVYPQHLQSLTPSVPATADPPAEGVVESVPFEEVVYIGRSSVLQAVDLKGLLRTAERVNRTIEIIAQVGDYVATGEPLFRVYPDAKGVFARSLHGSIAFGNERTAEQDPRFVFRILVDVACKALSPAINDPTTATLAIDQIHHLLRIVGRRNLETGEIRDRNGVLRVVMPTPGWESFVMLATTEIRQYGSGSIQVARRLRAMLENLITLLPAERRPILQDQLRMLRASVERSFVDAADQILATGSDLQGMGSGSDETAKKAVEPA